MTYAVVDTNVLVVANQAANHVSPECIMAAIDALSALRQSGVTALDDQALILKEYRGHASPEGQPGVGDAFLRHLYDNLYNQTACRLVRITPMANGSFAEFPRDQSLAGFDRDDRKFVAVALQCEPAAEVLNATDTDWWHYRDVLEENGISVRFLCPELMR